MSLANLSGRGFLLSDGVELKFGKTGTAYASLPISFRNSRKDPATGSWSHDKEFKVDVVVFGALAEALAESIDGRTELVVQGEPYFETWTDKEGRERTSVKMIGTAVWPTKPAERRVSAGFGSGHQRDENIPF
ncbi:MAG: single-stranded DNA-binding protein [Fluviibacter sp.]